MVLDIVSMKIKQDDTDQQLRSYHVMDILSIGNSCDVPMDQPRVLDYFTLIIDSSATLRILVLHCQAFRITHSILSAE
jgi:hypothetical protein